MPALVSPIHLLTPSVKIAPFLGSPIDWDAAAARWGTAFHTTRWLALVAKTKKVESSRYGIYAGRELVGIVPFSVRRYGPLRVAGSPLDVENSPYLGLAVAPEYLYAAIHELGSLLDASGVHFSRVILREDVEATDVGPGFEKITRHTHVVDLRQSEPAIWSDMQGRCRTAIRRAERSGVSVRPALDDSSFEHYLAMLERLYAAQRMREPSGRSFLGALWRTYSRDELALFVAEYEGQAIAGAMVLRDGATAYYLNGASVAAARSLNPSNLLQWVAMRWARSGGALCYDFVGSDIERLAKFKDSFGGKLTRYSLLERSSAWWVSEIRRRYPSVKSSLRSIRPAMFAKA